MAGSKGRPSNSHKQYYAKYDSVDARRRRIERHLKKQPNDEQAKEALKNLSHRGPRPSNNENGWYHRDMAQLGFYDTDRKKAVRLDQHDPKVIAWLRSIIKKAEKQEQHEKNYASKEERKKGGKSRA